MVYSGHRLLVVIGVVLSLLLFVIMVEFLIIKYNGSPVAVPDTPRTAETYGSGTPLIYAVLGDSTSVAQGGDYDRGYARSTARHLAGQGYAIRFQNFGVSGARAADVADQQAPPAAKLHPDVVLVAIGANDVTHLTTTDSVRHSLVTTIRLLRAANPQVVIILTGSPQMGSVPRFPQPVKYFAGVRSGQVNAAIRAVAKNQNVSFAPVAEKTGPVFMAHPELFAADKFHPDSAGYDLWTPVITAALDAAILK